MSEILAYFSLYPVDDLSQRDRIIRYVTQLDDVYLQYVAKQSKNKNGK